MGPKEPYLDEVICKRKSMLSGEGTETVSLTEMETDDGILGAFAKDIDIQEVTVVSTNIGFIRTYTKQYKKGV